MTDLRCSCCGSLEFRPLYTVRDRNRPDMAYDILECTVCGFGFVHPLPPADDAGDYYEAYWDADATEGGGSIASLITRYKQFLMATEANLVIRYCGIGKVLDIGCGDGSLLAMLRERGCDVEGTEVSTAGCEHARRVYAMTVHQGLLESLDLPLAAYDTVILSSVLEHMADPGRILQAVHRLINSKGQVYIVVPNSDSLQARYLKDRWFAVHPPQHISYFTVSSMRRLLVGHGFEPRVVHHNMFRHSPATLVSSLFPGLEPFRVQQRNLPYKPIRFALFLALTYLVLPFLLLERVVKRGGIIVMVARRLDA